MKLAAVKGQGKFIVVLVDLETHKLLGLAPERKQSEIEKVMLRWGDKVLSQVEEVSMDMSYYYKFLVNKLCPNASITVDKFHVTKIIHEELNQARIDQKKVAESLNVKKKLNFLFSLKGSKYIAIANDL
jgi:transposase